MSDVELAKLQMMSCVNEIAALKAHVKELREKLDDDKFFTCFITSFHYNEIDGFDDFIEKEEHERKKFDSELCHVYMAPTCRHKWWACVLPASSATSPNLADARSSARSSLALRCVPRELRRLVPLHREDGRVF